MKKLVIAVAVWLFLFAATARAQTIPYFVSTTGNDANDGSFGAPWRTIQNAVNSFIPSYPAAIYVKPGNYGEAVTITVTGVGPNLLTCYGGGPVITTSIASTTNWTVSSCITAAGVPTPTMSQSPTPSPTPTMSPTQTPTHTVSPTPTQSPTPGPTPVIYNLIGGSVFDGQVSNAQQGYVTTDPSLGGQGTAASPLSSNGTYNPQNSVFGAKCDGVTDDSIALQATIDAARAAQGLAAGVTPSVSIPATAKSCLHNFPLWIKFNTGNTVTGGRLFGAGEHSTAIQAAEQGELNTLIAPSDWTTTLSTATESAIGGGLGVLWGPPAVGSTGHSMLFDPSTGQWSLDLKMPWGPESATPVYPYDGFSAFDAEGWIYVDDTSNGHVGYWLGSHGLALQNIPPNGVASFGPIQMYYTVADGGLENTITLSAQTSSGAEMNGVVASGTFTSGHWHFIELSYDGSYYRLYIDGVEGEKHAGTGTTLDNAWTPLQMGMATVGPGIYPGGDWPAGGMFGWRISQIARNTSDGGYTPPTAALTCDANTLYLMNGTMVQASENGGFSASGPFVQPECINGIPTGTAPFLFWEPMYAWGTGTNQLITVDDLTFLGGSIGVLSSLNLDSEFDRIAVQGSTYIGWQSTVDTYDSHMRDVTVNAGGALNDFSLLAGGMHCTNCRVDPGAGYYPLIDASGIQYDSTFLQMSDVTLAAVIFNVTDAQGYGDVFNYLITDDEGGSVGPAVVGTVGDMVFNGGNLEAAYTTSPIVLYGAGALSRVIANGTTFTAIGGTPSAWVTSGFAVAAGYDANAEFHQGVYGQGPVPSTRLLRNAVPLTSNGVSYSAFPGQETTACTTAGSYSWTLAPYATAIGGCS